jgi:cytosine/adenosine deaminase-related metal-dependent hydrolase
MAEVLRARWILPIDRPPIDGGWLELIDDRIVRVGAGTPPATGRDLGDVAVLPGLVNAHTHLELSWLAGRVPAAGSMVEWIRRLLRERSAGAGDADAPADIRRAAHAMRAAGTVLAGEVTNTLETPSALSEAGMAGMVFHELAGFDASDPAGDVRDAWARIDAQANRSGTGDLEYAVVPHAPYSVSPALFVEIARRRPETRLSVHLAESPEEIEFLQTGAGPFRDLLQDLDVWSGRWRAPGCGPVEFLSTLGYLRPGLVVVHGVYLTDDELARLHRVGAVVVVCPRSNAWVGGGPPRLSRMYAEDVAVAVGTDSLASADSLSVFDELAEMRRIAPDVAAASLLESATRVGARALGRERDFGTLAPGKRAALTAVDVPVGVTDVEEYLVSGVPAASVRPVA